MQAEKRGNDVFILKPTEDEAGYFSNTLNEVLHGFRVDNFEHRLGALKHFVDRLRVKLIGSAFLAHGLCLSAVELTCLCKATRVCYEEFGEEEFSTRLGLSSAEAFKMVEELEGLLEAWQGGA